MACEGLWTGTLESGRYVEIYFDQVEPGLAMVDVSFGGDAVLMGEAQCHDTGYGETDVYMVFENNSEGGGLIDYDGVFTGGGIFGEEFSTSYRGDVDGWQ